MVILNYNASHVTYPGVASSIPARSHTFVEMAILLPSTDSKRVVVSYKRKCMHEVLVLPLSLACPGKKCG